MSGAWHDHQSTRMPLWKPIKSKYTQEKHEFEDMLQNEKDGAGKVMLKRMRDHNDRENMDALTPDDRKQGRRALTAAFLDVAQESQNMIKDDKNSAAKLALCDDKVMPLSSNNASSSDQPPNKQEEEDNAIELCEALSDIVKEKDTDAEDILLILSELEKVNMELDVLQKTGVGKVVAKLRSRNPGDTTFKEVRTLAGDLVKKWKEAAAAGRQKIVSKSVAPGGPKLEQLVMRVEAALYNDLITEDDNLTAYSSQYLARMDWAVGALAADQDLARGLLSGRLPVTRLLDKLEEELKADESD